MCHHDNAIFQVSQDDRLCDFSALQISSPNTGVKLNCQSAFICNTLEIDANLLDITTQNIYLSKDAQINGKIPAKAENGVDGEDLGEDGKSGGYGKKGLEVILEVDSFLPGSKSKMRYSLPGGPGGNGGNGKVRLYWYGPIPFEEWLLHFGKPFQPTVRWEKRERVWVLS